MNKITFITLLLCTSHINLNAASLDSLVTKLLFGAALGSGKEKVIETLKGNPNLVLDSFVYTDRYKLQQMLYSFQFQNHPLLRFPFRYGEIEVDTFLFKNVLLRTNISAKAYDTIGKAIHGIFIAFPNRKSLKRGYRELVGMFKYSSPALFTVIDEEPFYASDVPKRRSYFSTVFEDSTSEKVKTVHVIGIKRNKNVGKTRSLTAKPFGNRREVFLFIQFYGKRAYWLYPGEYNPDR